MKTTFLIVLLASVPLFGCKKKNINACISVDKSAPSVNETVSVTNCGDEPPSQADPSINWGDGASTEGASGTHTYAAAGTYTIELYIKGESIADELDDPGAIRKTVVIQ